MLIYFVTLLTFIFFYKYSLSIKQLSFQFLEDLSILFPYVNSLNNALSAYFSSNMESKAKRRCYKSKLNTKIENTETNTISESRLLDLPDLALETILEKLEPADLCKMACVSTYFRDICLTDYLWKQHMKQRWGRLIGSVAQKEWMLRVASQKHGLDGAESRGFLSKLWPVMMFKFNDERKPIQPPDTCSIVSCYRALETGRFWFPAQIFNRENGHVGFVMSCYDAELSYDSQTDTFEARYPPHGPRAVASESGVTWDRLREVPVDNSAHDLHTSTCLNELRPKDHIEIQWRRNKQFPYGWWYGVIGHLESCDANDTYCRCHESDMVMLEFKQYAPGSRWRHMTINRKEHREEGNEAEGFYGGIKKLYNKDEIWVSPLAGLRDNGFVAGQAMKRAETKKVEKHAKACEENQHVFVPLAFDTFGSLAPEAIRFLTRVQQVVHSNVSTPKGQGYVFSRLGFAIQKGVAAQLVARLPAMLM